MAKFCTQTRDDHAQYFCWVLCLQEPLLPKNYFFQKTNLHVGLQFCSGRSAGQLAAAKAGRRPWPRPVLLTALLLIALGCPVFHKNQTACLVIFVADGPLKKLYGRIKSQRESWQQRSCYVDEGTQREVGQSSRLVSVFNQQHL